MVPIISCREERGRKTCLPSNSWAHSIIPWFSALLLCLLSKPSDYKVFFSPVLLLFAGKLPKSCLVTALALPIPFQQTFTEVRGTFFVIPD